MRVLPQLIQREFRLFWQNKVLVTAFFVLSVVLSTVMGFVYQKGKLTGQRILVIDRDHSPSSARLIDMLSENETLEVNEIKYEAVGVDRLLLEKKATAVVVIPYRFEAAILQSRKAEINCYLNMSNTLKANGVRAAIQLCVSTLNAGRESFHHNVFLQYNRTNNFLIFLWPGLIMGILHQLILIVTAVGFSQELANHTFDAKGLLGYSRKAPILYLAKIFPCLVMSFWILGIDYLLSLYFGVVRPAHPWLLLLSALLMVIGACCFGTLISIIIPLPVKATQVLMSFASPALTLAGFTWPTDHIPFVLRAIANIIPLKPFLNAAILLWQEGATWQQVLPQLDHQLILIAIYSCLGMLLLRKKINKNFNDTILIDTKA